MIVGYGILDLSIQIGDFKLKNPISLASGTAGYGEELAVFMDISRIGAIFTKGISLEPRRGNRGPRIVETPSGVLNSIGLENIGLNRFLKEKLPFLLERGATVIPNIAGYSIDENVELCRILSNTNGIPAVELNVSCPNVSKGGMAFGREMNIFSKLIKRVRRTTDKVLIVKLSPNVADVVEFASAAKDLGADAVSAVNTYLGMKIDIERRKPLFFNKVAGLSGPAIRPLAVRTVYEIFDRVDIPIIGIGGITDIDDVIEFIMAGASVISIGTMNMINPRAGIECLENLEEYMEIRGINSMHELIGSAHKGFNKKQWSEI
ncbi:MAG: dihydroorotate dehydrogenase [Spirochaetota bacterium]|nr:dihydroorotate dehydrogenase [Spirochaetota bacterium]